MLDNPIWRRPLISLGNGNFFCPIPNVFISFIFPIFNELIKDSIKIKEIMPERRAHFLEAELGKLFSSAFPGCEIVHGFKWKNAGNEYENDLIIRIDSHLILVEAKSGAISWPALRGAPERMKRHIEDLLYEPSCQSFRLAEQIKMALESAESQDSYLPGLTIKLEKVRTVIRLSITLEDFGAIQSNLQLIKEAGWVPDSHRLAPCIMLSDLKIVFDVLESIGQKLHYLRRRTEIAENMKIIGDELELLGMYLSMGFNFGEVEYNGTHLLLTGMSSKIDEYFTACTEGIIPKNKPCLKLSPWWKDICAGFEYRKFFQWTDACNLMLNISFDEQIKGEKMFKNIKQNVQKNWKKPNHQSTIILIPNKHKSDALALYAFKDIEQDNRLERMNNIGAKFFAESHVQRCLVLGMNIDKNHYPYTTMAVFYRDKMKDILMKEIKVY